MLAQVFVNRGYAGLRLTTPEQTWESFLKLNQKATVETYEMLVSDYVAETPENPDKTFRWTCSPSLTFDRGFHVPVAVLTVT